MKPFQLQTHYELLEVSVAATSGEIRGAFDRLARLYSDEQVALYGLIEPERAEALRRKLEEALATLTDDERRDDYDRSIGLPPREGAPPKAPPKKPVAPAAAAPSNGGGWGGFSYAFVSPVPAPPVQSPATWTWVVPQPAVAAPVVAPAFIPAPSAPAPAAIAAPAPIAAPLAAPVEEVEPELAPVVVPPPPPPEALLPPSAPPAPPVEAAPPPPPASPPPLPVRPSAPQEEAPVATLRPSSAPHAFAQAGPPPLPVRPPSELAPLDEPDVPRLAEDGLELSIVPSRASSPVAREYRAPEPRPRPFEVPAGVEFNGELLRQVRMARGMTLLQLAERTRISTKHLENVEGDRYDALPAAVYLRGILMNLSRELGLDGVQVAKSYLSFVEALRTKD